jgi:hypothetical protein
MSPGAKIFLTLTGIGVVFGGLALASSKSSSAAPLPKPQDDDETPPDVVVSPIPGTPGSQQPPSSPPVVQLPPQIPGLPQMPIPAPTGPVAPSNPAPSGGTTFDLPNPLGGPPIGQFNPATGNVFGPGGIVIGTFNPNTGIFQPNGGLPPIQIPGFGGSSPPVLPVPTQPPAASLPPTPGQPTGPAQPTPPASPPASAPVTTIERDTAAMVAALLAAEASPGWNSTDPNVQIWQKARPPLVVDAKFGPKTALKVAETFGTIPIVRFWPLGTAKAKLLQDYRAGLLSLANASADPVRAQQLRFSAQREQAQAFSVKGKAPAIPSELQVQIAKVA